MPAWFRSTLILVMLLSCMIIGARLYQELQTDDRPDGAGPVAEAPAKLTDFVLDDVWGEPRSISEWSGKPMLINFWATWCAPCRREMPLLQAMHTQQAQTGIQIIGVAIDRQPDVETYITESGISYPILVGEEDAMAVSDQFGLQGLGLPFSVLISADGQILTVYVGELVSNQLAEIVRVSQDTESGELDAVEARQRLSKL